MNDIDSEPLDPDLIALLRADFEPAPSETKARVSQRLALSIGAQALSTAQPASARPSTTAWAGFCAHPGVFIFGVALGSAVGAGLVATLQKPVRPEIRYVDRPVSEPSAPAPRARASAEREMVPALPLKPAAIGVNSTPTTASARSGTTQLADQQAMLDVARRAFARSDYESALQTLDAHEKRFPKSMLGEEREALRIKTLAATGQLAEAKARATRFKARFPQSLLLPSLLDSLGEIP